jgi:hypothetical protein
MEDIMTDEDEYEAGCHICGMDHELPPAEDDTAREPDDVDEWPDGEAP